METSELVIQRQEHLYRLGEFCAALRDAVAGAGFGPDEARELFRTYVAAECVGCKIHVSGEELFALSQPPAPEYASAKTGRLRRGDCARQGCDAYYYQVSFMHYAQIDWPTILCQVDRIRSVASSKPLVVNPRPAAWWSLMSARMLGKAVALTSVLLFLLLLRQLHQGGRIPLLREPEHFQVDVAPEGQLSGRALR
jgi:hypothetical protein